MIFEKMLKKRLIFSLFFIIIILLSVLWIIQSLRFINVLVNEKVSFFNYLKLIIFLIPDIVTIILPFCILIAGIYVYSKMTSNNETQILFGLGVSKLQISKPFIKVALISCLFGIISSVWLLPLSLRYFKEQRFKVNHHVLSLFIAEEQFFSIKDSTFFFEKKLTDSNGFKNIFINSKDKTIMARKALFITSNNECLYLKLIDGFVMERADSLTKIDFKSLLYKIEQFSAKRLKTIAEEDTISLFFPKTKMRIEGHKRIILPLLILINAFLVCALILKNISIRTNNSFNIVKIISIAFFIDFLCYEVLCLSKHNFNLVYCIYTSMALLTLFCLYSLSRFCTIIKK